MSFRLFQSLFSAPASQVVRREKRRVQVFLVPSTLLRLTCVKSKRYNLRSSFAYFWYFGMLIWEPISAWAKSTRKADFF